MQNISKLPVSSSRRKRQHRDVGTIDNQAYENLTQMTERAADQVARDTQQVSERIRRAEQRMRGEDVPAPASP